MLVPNPSRLPGTHTQSGQTALVLAWALLVRDAWALGRLLSTFVSSLLRLKDSSLDHEEILMDSSLTVLLEERSVAFERTSTSHSKQSRAPRATTKQTSDGR